MNPHLFFEHFDVLAEAPGGIAKLRELILKLAVQGKLVPQDRNDEPAAELFGRIEEIKERLIKQRTIKRVSVEPNPSEDTLEPLPLGWLWTRLGNAFDVRDGTHATPKYTSEGFPLITSKNIYSGSLLFEGANLISEEDHRQICERSRVDRGDILFAMIGSIGNPVIVDTDREFSIKNVALFKYYSVADSEPRFLLQYLNLVSEEMKAKAAGGVQSFVSLGFLRNYPFPLPPLAEQRRIVAKVDELMARCDELEARQKAKRETRERLVASSLDKLTSARDAVEFDDYWHRLRDHFGLLFDHPSTIPPLRQAILQIAVQGKLVPQNPKEEPASVLRSLIQSKRGDLWGLGEDSNGATDTGRSKDCPNCRLPNGWESVRLGELGCFLGGGTPSKNRAEYWDGKIPWVSPKDMKRPYLDDAIDHVSALGVENSSGKMIPAGSLLMVVRGMILSHSFPVALTLRDLTINQDMKALRLAVPETGEYLLWCCSALKARMLAKVERSSHGTCRLPSDEVANFPIPLPPLYEQKRIIAKIHELMSLCDEVESKLARAESASESLLTASVVRLLGDNAGAS